MAPCGPVCQRPRVVLAARVGCDAERQCGAAQRAPLACPAAPRCVARTHAHLPRRGQRSDGDERSAARRHAGGGGSQVGTGRVGGRRVEGGAWTVEAGARGLTGVGRCHNYM